MDEQKQVLEQEVPALKEKALALKVIDTLTRQNAEVFVKTLRSFKDKIEERFHPTKNKKDAYKLYEQTLDTEKAFYVPIDEAIKIASETVKEYDRKQAIAAREAAEKIERERQERERVERERMERESREAVEKAKLEEQKAKEAREREAAAKIEKEEAEKKLAEASAAGDATAKKVAEIEVKAKDREIKINAEAAETAEIATEGHLEQAQVAQEQSESVSLEPKPTPVAKEVKKLVWKARVISVKIACRSIGEGLLPFTMVDIKPGELNKIAKDYDGKTRIPGIEFYEDVSGRI